MTEEEIKKCPKCGDYLSDIGSINYTGHGTIYTEYCNNRECDFEKTIPIIYEKTDYINNQG